MAERIRHFHFKHIAAAFLSLAFIFGFCSCSMIEDILESGLEELNGSEDSDRTKHTRHDSETSEYTYKTLEPTGTYPDETEDQFRPDYAYVSSVYVYSIWYDPTEDNPLRVLNMESKDAFALKGVFYFSTPLSVEFEAKLYKNDAVLLTRTVKLKDNVTGEADFSAGLEGFGVFEKGFYKIELLYDGETLGYTPIFEVY